MSDQAEIAPTEADSTETKTGQDAPLAVVGIGASAGGLAALKAFFAEMPASTGLAFVVVVHLAPDHDSLLAELLQPSVRFPVVQVSEPMALEADHVYVIPLNRKLNSIDTHLRTSPLEKQRIQRSPIDHFLSTLSATHDGNSVAVILSGTGSDGALGVTEVKQGGGLTVVQDPSEADYDGLPQSAISTGMVDLVLPVARIPEAVIGFASTAPNLVGPAGDAEPGSDDLQLLHKILVQVNAQTGRDFSRYKPSTVMRQIRRRMQMVHLEDFADYLARVRSDTSEVTRLSDELLVTVSSFFRDNEVFERLQSEVVPRIFDNAVEGEDIRVWSVGCATGEEAYSLAMVFIEEAERRDFAPHFQIFASDLHEHSLERARAGRYTSDIESDVTPERLARFFTAEDGGYRTRDVLRDLVVFAPHNLLFDPPFSKLDLLACRNVLIYLQRDVQDAVAGLFHYALKPDGWLMLGASETIDGSQLFQADADAKHFYRNVPVQPPRLPVFPLTRAVVPAGLQELAAEADPLAAPRASYAELHRRLLGRIGPASMLVSPDDRVLHLSQNAARYLMHPSGEITANVTQLVRDELALELRSALHEARESPEPSRSPAVLLPGSAIPVRVIAQASTTPGEEGFVLVTFSPIEEQQHPVGAPSTSGSTDDELAAERHLLTEAQIGRDLARQHLQAISERFETGQEELQASNEELQSANEELWSSLEELETSKEELQSMNEELQTVNQENRHKVEELAQLTNDLQNLLVATDIATLFLDRELRILRFTPRVTELFNVRPTDSGRPISDLTHRLVYGELAADAAQVLADLTPIERELVDESGRNYFCRLLAYRSTDDHIDGVVITFIDITTRKAAEDEVRRSAEWTRQVIEAVPSVIFTATPDGSIDYVSSQMERRFGVPGRKFLGAEGWQSFVHPDDRDNVVARWQAALKSNERFQGRYRIYFGDDTWRWVLEAADPVTDDNGELRQWVGTLTDVDALAVAEHSLFEANAELKRNVDERTQQVRALAATLTMAEEAERRRVGEMLHDNLQQQLYGLQLLVGFAHDDAATERTVEAMQRLDEARDRLNEALATTRNLSIELSPPWRSGDSLGEALASLKPQMRELHGLDFELKELARIEASESVRATLYRMVRELLFNVAKHADVDRAVVEVDGDEDQVVVRVHDSGEGFEEQVLADHSRTGLGLVGIRERIRLLGGSFALKTAPGGGTQVEVTLPLNGASAEVGENTSDRVDVS